jgi:hypothetical protein
MSDTQRVTAIFENKTKAIHAINHLETIGYNHDSISLLVSENSWNSKEDIKIQENSKAPEGTAIGATTGGIAAGVVAGLTATGAVALTGGAGLLAAGPLVAAFAGAGAGGAAGGIVGGLVGMGIPEVEAKFVDEELGHGHVLVGIETDKERVNSLKESLKDFSPKKVTIS